uniref:Uncharacterized protein n=1 Tax=Arundo donax TaxID=35708 RepID=A0A0A8Z5V2_ARUDO
MNNFSGSTGIFVVVHFMFNYPCIFV